jgi:predicted RND superfamily exporter protein
MQDDLQDTIILGVFLCFITLWWGFRDSGTTIQRIRRNISTIREKAPLIFFNIIIFAIISLILLGEGYLLHFVALALIMSLTFGTTSFIYAGITTTPIFIMIIWLYALVDLFGYGLNMVTVSIAAISLGVGVDYVIHLIERYREEIEEGKSQLDSIAVVGGASGLALFGSALSDFAGFMVINQSKMGFFSTFRLFCAIMIVLSLIASMVIAPALIGMFHRSKNYNM